MQDSYTIEQLEELRGTNVYDSAGDKIGEVEEIFWDEQTRRPEWIGLGAGFFGTKRVLVPVTAAEQRADGLVVPYSKDQVRDAPDVDSDEISQETEYALARHYGLDYSEDRSDTGLPEERAGIDAGADASDQASVTRSEEELHVGKERVGAGAARLRKWVDTEPVEMDVELQRETARITREPVNEVVSGAELREEEIEVPLHEERPVVEKRVVAKERIGLETEVESERRTVADEVRKERVDVDDDAR